MKPALLLVDVVRLRRAGRAIPEDEAKSASAVRGHLFFDSPMRLGRAALYREPQADGPEVLPELAGAVLSKIDEESLLIVGMEGHLPDVSDGIHPQTWWCRLVKV